MISIDSRNWKPGETFIPVKGVHFDGHRYIPDILKQNGKILDMDLSQYAHWRRQTDLKQPLIAVTGSSGKTTLKDRLAQILGHSYKVHKTPENLNNEIGVPLSLINCPVDTELIILELAMRHRGEIRSLTRIVEPDCVVVSSIGTAHLENLKTRRNILYAKAEIFDFPKSNNKHYHAFIPADLQDNGLMARLAHRRGFIVHAIPADSPFHQTDALVNAVGIHFEIEKNELKSLLKKAPETSSHRQTSIPWSSNLFIDDSYNANPESMKFAIEKLQADFPGGKLGVILGEMKELGPSSKKRHEELQTFVCQQKHLNWGIFVGESYKEFEKTQQRWYTYKSLTEAIQHLQSRGLKENIILVKGSRSTRMETIIQEVTST